MYIRIERLLIDRAVSCCLIGIALWAWSKTLFTPKIAGSSACPSAKIWYFKKVTWSIPTSIFRITIKQFEEINKAPCGSWNNITGLDSTLDYPYMYSHKAKTEMLLRLTKIGFSHVLPLIMAVKHWREAPIFGEPVAGRQRVSTIHQHHSSAKLRFWGSDFKPLQLTLPTPSCGTSAD